MTDDTNTRRFPPRRKVLSGAKLHLLLPSQKFSLDSLGLRRGEAVGWTAELKAPRFLTAVRDFFFSETCRLVLEPTQSPIQLQPAALSPGLGGQGFKLITHQGLVPRLKHEWSYTSSSPIYEGCSESKERLRIQPAQLFHCTRSVMWCVQ